MESLVQIGEGADRSLQQVAQRGVAERLKAMARHLVRRDGRKGKRVDAHGERGRVLTSRRAPRKGDCKAKQREGVVDSQGIAQSMRHRRGRGGGLWARARAGACTGPRVADMHR